MFRLKPAEELFPVVREKQIGILARVPLASGLLSGKLRRDSTFEPRDHRNYNRHGEAFDVGETFSGVDYDTGLQAVEELRALVPAGATHGAARAALDPHVPRGVGRDPRREERAADGGQRARGRSTTTDAAPDGRGARRLRSIDPPAGTPPMVAATDAPVRWGILGAANIAVKKVVPAMQRGARCQIVAIASRDAGQGAARGAGARAPARLRLVRGAARRPRRRSDLQPAAQPPARAVDDPRRRGGEARAVREADRALGRRSAPAPRRARAHRRPDRRSVHGAQPSAVARRARSREARQHRRPARRRRPLRLLQARSEATCAAFPSGAAAA